MARWQAAAARAMRVICAAVLLSLGFAHQAPASVLYDASHDATAYALPDGSIPALCGETEGHGGKIVIKPGCEVCRLAASILLPKPDDGAWLAANHAFLLNPLGVQAGIFGPRSVGRANSRAPPLFL